MRHHPQARAHARGFSLLEALIALLVLSFGMLAIAGFQTTLARSSDLAKQRSEATRLAQQKMETLRSFGQVATDPTTGALHKFNYTDDVVSSTVLPYTGPEVVTTNATFSRTWTVTANAANTEKWINVQVAWTDRTGQAQNVQLLSVISKFDPQDIGTLATGPGGTNVRRPKNRNINIPYPAVTLSGGTQSAFIPPPGNVAYVFDNGTGNIVQSCTGLTTNAPVPVAITTLTLSGNTVTVTAPGHSFAVNYTVAIAGANDTAYNGTFTIASVAGNDFTYVMTTPPAGLSASGGMATRVNGQLLEGLNLANSGATCTNLDAYLLSGYVRFDTGNSPTGEEPGSPGNDNDTLPLNAATPLSLDTSNVPTPNLGGGPTMVCYAQRQKVVTTSNTTPVNINSVSRNGSTVTVTAPGHAFVAGQTVAVNGTNDKAYIGAFVINSATAGSSFTYTLPPPLPTGTTTSGGTAALVQRLTIADGASVSGYSNVASLFVAYACVVTPVDHDNVAGTRKRWWGKVTLNPNTVSANGTVWAIGTTGGQYKVCRYSADYNDSNTISNSEHPQWYRKVTGSLDSQNFLVINALKNSGQPMPCPTDERATPLANTPNYSDDTTAAHQPTGEQSFQCLTAACSGGNKDPREPVSDSSDIDMD